MKKINILVMVCLLLGAISFWGCSGDSNNIIEENNSLDSSNEIDEIVEYILGGSNTGFSKKVVTTSDVYGAQEDTVYEIPEGTYKLEMLPNNSVGKAGLVEIESRDITKEVEDGEAYEYFNVRETISFNVLTNEVESHEITVNINEQIDINGNIVIKLTKIR